jgi:hypothetical protein
MAEIVNRVKTVVFSTSANLNPIMTNGQLVATVDS